MQNSAPEDEVASDDNKVLKSFIVNTKKSIPNNIEQEKEQKRLIEIRFNDMIKRRKIKYSFIFRINYSIYFIISANCFIWSSNFESFLTFNSDKKILKHKMGIKCLHSD